MQTNLTPEWRSNIKLNTSVSHYLALYSNMMLSVYLKLVFNLFDCSLIWKDELHLKRFHAKIGSIPY